VRRDLGGIRKARCVGFPLVETYTCDSCGKGFTSDSALYPTSLVVWPNRHTERPEGERHPLIQVCSIECAEKVFDAHLRAKLAVAP
jgi:hypothetical protein